MKAIETTDIVAVGIYNAQAVFKTRTITPHRKTTMYEIELPIGEGGVSYIDDSSSAVSEKMVICAKPGQVRYTRLPFRCYYIHLIASGGIVSETLSSLPNFIEVEGTEELREIFSSMCEHFGTGIPSDSLMLHSLLLRLVYLLSRQAVALRGHTPKRNNGDIIVETIEYIKNNLALPLTLESLSGRSHFTKTYFHKLFKRSTGKTLREYIEDVRIKKAVELLTSTDMTLSMIAYECGFSSQSYFNYAFKKKMGLTPREYVKSIYMKYEK